MKNQAFILFSDDIKLVTGMSLRYAQRMIKTAWILKGLPHQRWISVPDFCKMSGLSEETVQMKLAQQ